MQQIPLLYLITNRNQLPAKISGPDYSPIIDFIASAASAGIDLIQIREKDLPARDIYLIAKSAAEAVKDTPCRILINDRADIAAAIPGVGVHLTSSSISPETVRRAFGTGLLIGISTHSVRELETAASGRADFAVFGPVFETPSKAVYGPPQGIEALKAAVWSVNLPVIALGGINDSNYCSVLESGAAGIAAISLFHGSQDLPALVRQLKSS